MDDLLKAAILYPPDDPMILRHSSVSDAGTQAGNDWSAATKTMGRPPFPTPSHQCIVRTSHARVAGLFFVSKESEVLVLSLTLWEMVQRKICSSPPLVKLVQNLACSTEVGAGFNCRRITATRLAAFTVACVPPISRSGTFYPGFTGVRSL